MLIDWFTTIAQVINFLILVWLLKHFLYKPILHAIDERETQIATRLSNAEKIQLDAKKNSDELKTKIKQIDDQRSALLTKAEEEAQVEHDRLLEEAKKAIDVFTEKKRKDFKREEAQINKTIIQQVQSEVFAITRKVLMDLTGVTLESQMIDVFLRRLSELNEEEKNIIKSVSSSSSNQGIVRSTFELTQKQRTDIKNIMSEHFNEKNHLQFEISPNLFGGIELTINGRKLAWSVDNYLPSMEKEVHKLLNPEIQSHEKLI